MDVDTQRGGTPADIIPLSLVKDFLNFDEDLDIPMDSPWKMFAESAIDSGEHYTGVTWAKSLYETVFKGIVRPPGSIFIPVCPVFSTPTVVFVLEDGSREDFIDFSFHPSDFKLSPWSRIDLQRPPPIGIGCSIEFSYEAGWGAEDLPGSLRHWALQRVATAHGKRTDVTTWAGAAPMPRFHGEGLLDRWSVFGGPYG